MRQKNSAPKSAQEHKKSGSNLSTVPSEKNHQTKRMRVLSVLRAGASLNRFEAERIGDHCLNSTVSALRADGYLILAEWEMVPTRFGRTARVLRYRLVKAAA